MSEMLSKGMLRDFLRQTQGMVQSGRTCDPGDFYLIHVTGTTTDPWTGEVTETTSDEYIEPVVYELKGDEHITVPGGLLEMGDIICSFPDDGGIVLSDVRQVVWKSDTYLVKSPSPYSKGLGTNVSRKRLFCSREG